jgi:Holliday junction resolvase RusA-like endonuclease
LPSEKFPQDYPYGNDLDNLLKRLFDALNQTVFSNVPGNDSCVIAVEAEKVRARDDSSGAELEIIPRKRVRVEVGTGKAAAGAVPSPGGRTGRY